MSTGLYVHIVFIFTFYFVYLIHCGLVNVLFYLIYIYIYYTLNMYPGGLTEDHSGNTFDARDLYISIYTVYIFNFALCMLC